MNFELFRALLYLFSPFIFAPPFAWFILANIMFPERFSKEQKIYSIVASLVAAVLIVLMWKYVFLRGEG
jgi:hypothetical protein